MDLRKLKTLIDLVSESNVSELEITEAEGKIRIVKGGGQWFNTSLPSASLSARHLWRLSLRLKRLWSLHRLRPVTP